MTVNDVSFGVKGGEIIGIAGIEGNGQTELVDVITGLKRQTTGKFILKGMDITDATIRTKLETGMGHIPEDRHKHGLVLDFNLAENLVLENYYLPAFPEARLHQVRRRRRKRRVADPPVRHPFRRRSRLRGPLDVRRKSAEGDHLARNRPRSRTARRRPADPRPRRRRDRIHPRTASERTRFGQGDPARESRA
ncbi:MAG: ATP-binding cassette domain-containing protein [Desulfomicrobium escambiense]|nr:ATP-binding cassette domain-containing protein [Desulfomicrobium escambiense]